MADGGFGWSEGIAALSLGVSIFALAWAKASAGAARQANSIQLHVYQKQTYLEFKKLKRIIEAEPNKVGSDDVSMFRDSAETCFLYFPVNLADELYGYYRLCDQLATQIKINITMSERLKEYHHPSEQAHSSLIETLHAGHRRVYELANLAVARSLELDLTLVETINVLQKRPTRMKKFKTAIVSFFRRGR